MVCKGCLLQKRQSSKQQSASPTASSPALPRAPGVCNAFAFDPCPKEGSESLGASFEPTTRGCVNALRPPKTQNCKVSYKNQLYWWLSCQLGIGCMLELGHLVRALGTLWEPPEPSLNNSSEPPQTLFRHVAFSCWAKNRQDQIQLLCNFWALVAVNPVGNGHLTCPKIRERSVQLTCWLNTGQNLKGK